MKASELRRENGDVQHTYSRLPRNPRPACDLDIVSTLKAREVRRNGFSDAGSKKQEARKKQDGRRKQEARETDGALRNPSQLVPTHSTSEKVNSSAQLLEGTASTAEHSTSPEASAFESIDRSDDPRAGFQQPGISRRQSNAFVFASQVALGAPAMETETATDGGDTTSFDEVPSFDEMPPAAFSDRRWFASLRR